jgi:arylsulfatase A-like enzyme
MVGCYTPDDPRFLPHVLSAKNYHTASIGKIHLVSQGAEPQAIEQTEGDYFGFQTIDLVNGHGDNCFGPKYTPVLRDKMPDFEIQKRKRQKYKPGVKDSHSYELPPEMHSSNYIGDRTVEFLEQTADKPFFLHVSFPDPHHPFTVPAPYDTMYDPDEMPAPIPPLTETSNVPSFHLDTYFARNYRIHNKDKGVDRVIGTKPEPYYEYTLADWQKTISLYYGMITLLDENVGRILDTLESTSLADNTLVIFTADHGEYLGDHGLYGKGLPYHPSLNVPLIFSGPNVQADTQIDNVATTLDIVPTIYDTAQIAEPEGVQGQSLKSVLNGQELAFRKSVLTENDDDFVPMKMRTLTTNDWKLTYYANEPFGELYDRKNDPQELNNLWNAPSYAELRTELMNRLLEEVICSFDVANGRRQKPSPPQAIKWIPKHNQLKQ